MKGKKNIPFDMMSCPLWKSNLAISGVVFDYFPFILLIPDCIVVNLFHPDLTEQ
jgi:hypothetical protein